MIKHVGTHNQKRIIIIYRELPNEPHMCLVVYGDLLPRTFHDSIMPILESPAGQQSKNLADPLFRNYLPDGRIILHALHKEGLLKKIQTNQVIVTPTSKNTARLDELNEMLNKIEQGDQAANALKEKDAALGMGTGVKKSVVDGRTTSASVNPDAMPAPAFAGQALSDETLANSLLQQSTKMKTEAAVLLAESARLESEAEQLNPALAKEKKKLVSKTAKSVFKPKALAAK